MQQSTQTESDIVSEAAPEPGQRKQWDALRIESVLIRDTQNIVGGGSDTNTSAS